VDSALCSVLTSSLLSSLSLSRRLSQRPKSTPTPNSRRARNHQSSASSSRGGGGAVEENSGGGEEEEEGQDDDELELGLCLGSKKQQPPSAAPCRILTARDLQPGISGFLRVLPNGGRTAGPGAAAPSNKAKADAAPNATTSPGGGDDRFWPPREVSSNNNSVCRVQKSNQYISASTSACC